MSAEDIFFRGIDNLSLDSKGRLAIPARYRQALQDVCQGRLVCSIDHDGCLVLYPLPAWEQVERQLSELPDYDVEARNLKRMLLGHASNCELDSQGRILLPAMLREYAGIEKGVVLSGQGNKLEIWDGDAHKARIQEWRTAARNPASMHEALKNIKY